MNLNKQDIKYYNNFNYWKNSKGEFRVLSRPSNYHSCGYKDEYTVIDNNAIDLERDGTIVPCEDIDGISGLIDEGKLVRGPVKDTIGNQTLRRRSFMKGVFGGVMLGTVLITVHKLLGF